MARVKRASAKNVPHGNLSVEEKYNIQAKLDDPRFDITLVKDMAGGQFSIDYVHKNGFFHPIRFLEKIGLGKYTAISSFRKFFDMSSYLVTV